MVVATAVAVVRVAVAIVLVVIVPPKRVRKYGNGEIFRPWKQWVNWSPN